MGYLEVLVITVGINLLLFGFNLWFIITNRNDIKESYLKSERVVVTIAGSQTITEHVNVRRLKEKQDLLYDFLDVEIHQPDCNKKLKKKYKNE